MRLDIAKALELYDEADNLAKDWYLKSIHLKDEDKQIALLYWQKADKERAKLIRRLKELCKNQN